MNNGAIWYERIAEEGSGQFEEADDAWREDGSGWWNQPEPWCDQISEQWKEKKELRQAKVPTHPISNSMVLQAKEDAERIWGKAENSAWTKGRVDEALIEEAKKNDSLEEKATMSHTILAVYIKYTSRK